MPPPEAAAWRRSNDDAAGYGAAPPLAPAAGLMARGRAVVFASPITGPPALAVLAFGGRPSQSAAFDALVSLLW